jgi:hypothetical protein
VRDRIVKASPLSPIRAMGEVSPPARCTSDTQASPKSPYSVWTLSREKLRQAYCPVQKSPTPASNLTLIFRMGFVAPLPHETSIYRYCPHNGRILLVILFPHDTAAVTVLDSRESSMKARPSPCRMKIAARLFSWEFAFFSCAEVPVAQGGERWVNVPRCRPMLEWSELLRCGPTAAL